MIKLSQSCVSLLRALTEPEPVLPYQVRNAGKVQLHPVAGAHRNQHLGVGRPRVPRKFDCHLREEPLESRRRDDLENPGRFIVRADANYPHLNDDAFVRKLYATS